MAETKQYAAVQVGPDKLMIVESGNGKTIGTFSTGGKIISVTNSGSAAFVITENGFGKPRRTMYNLPNGSGQPF